MCIRPYKSDDFEAIESIYNVSKLDELRYENQIFELLPLLSDEHRLNSLLESQIIVYDDHEILGYGAYLDSEIRSLFVHPATRNQNIGSKLLVHMLKLATVPARLFVAKSNKPAKQLYSKYGFKVTEEFQTSYNGIPVLANKMEQSFCLFYTFYEKHYVPDL